MRYEIEGQLLSDIGDAIREKTGKSELILPGDMPGEIESIKGESNGCVPLLSQAEWDALTVVQKEAYGLVAVQRSDSGYMRGVVYYGSYSGYAKAAEMTPVYAWCASTNGGATYTFTGLTQRNEVASHYLAVMMQNALASANAYWTASESLLPALAYDNKENDYAVCYGMTNAIGEPLVARTYTHGDNWNNGEIVCFAFSGDAMPAIKELFYIKGKNGTYSYTYQAGESECLLLIIMRGGSGSQVEPTVSGLTRTSSTTATGARHIKVYYGAVSNGGIVSISAPYTVGDNNLGSLLVVLMSVNVKDM